MLAFEDARTQLLGLASVAEPEVVPTTDALGRVLASQVVAAVAQPSYDNSAMDGYALDTASLPSKPPFSLPVSGESRAGRPLSHLQPGHACRIFTGAQIPAGANAVLLQENAQSDGATLTFTHLSQPGEHIRRRGEDLAEGAVAIEAGTRLGPFHLGLCAALEQPRVAVVRRPRVTILCTGDELRRPGMPALPGTIPESNSSALRALLQQAGADVSVPPIVPDDLVETERRIKEALDQSDLVLTVGGVSVGTHDCVRAALQRLGATLEFWKVRIKPGKPLAVARLGSKLVLGLPGNPVSAQITCVLFVLPLIRKLQGQQQLFAPFRPMHLLTHLHQTPGRTGFFRARMSETGVTPLLRDGSGSVTSMANADALVMADSETAEFPAGSLVPTLNLYEALYL